MEAEPSRLDQFQKHNDKRDADVGISGERERESGEREGDSERKH
jgi:hypothetical protein